MSFRKVDYDSSEGRRLVVDRFLNSVVIYDDYILINMNFNNSTKQVDIKELDAPAKRSSLKSLSPPMRKGTPRGVPFRHLQKENQTERRFRRGAKRAAAACGR